MNTPRRPGPRPAPFPLIRQPHRQPRALRLLWGLVTLALWTMYGRLALPLLSARLWSSGDLLGWSRHHHVDLLLLWVFAVAASGASFLLVAWAEIDRVRRRRRRAHRLPDAGIDAIARRLHASNAIRKQLARGKIMRVHLDERARPIRAEAQPVPAPLQPDHTAARVCPSPRTTKRSTVKASSPIGP